MGREDGPEGGATVPRGRGRTFTPREVVYSLGALSVLVLATYGAVVARWRTELVLAVVLGIPLVIMTLDFIYEARKAARRGR